MRLLSIIFVFILCTVFYAQKLSVNNISPLTSPEQGEFYYPYFHPDNNRVFFTRANNTGLYYYDLTDLRFVELNTDAGAGYQPVFSEDGNYVYYRRQKYINRRLFSDIVQQNISSGAKTVIVREKRLLSTPYLYNGQELVYTEKNSVSMVNTATGKKSDPLKSSIKPAVFIEDTKIALYSGAQKQILTPLGDGNYIWPSVSPNGLQLLFTKAGFGTYISDLAGNILHEIGYANAPQWSPDGQWIVYMVDRDDGHFILESDIFIVSADVSSRIQLTDTSDEIEMYPQWGPDSRRIVYSTERGQIFLLELTGDE